MEQLTSCPKVFRFFDAEGGSHQSITEESERHSDLASDLARRAQHIETLKGHKMALKEYLPE
jgi:uncharacterized protein YhbP (UPF0306 family)